ncbi:MAG: penicillin-binding protein 2, partial [Bacteroidota bacterium]
MSEQHNIQRTRISIRVMQILFGMLCLVVLGRVFFLQVVEYEQYSLQGERNSIRQEIIPPPRGLIYDNKGELLVDNVPIFT